MIENIKKALGATNPVSSYSVFSHYPVLALQDAAVAQFGSLVGLAPSSHALLYYLNMYVQF